MSIDEKALDAAMAHWESEHYIHFDRQRLQECIESYEAAKTPPSLARPADATEVAGALRKLIPWAKEALNDREQSLRLSRDDDTENQAMAEQCSMEIEEAEFLLAKLDGNPTE